MISLLQVSWMRKKDLHILTSETFVFSGDQRFSVQHPQDTDEWNLKIENAQSKDSGEYSCQVNTEPKIKLAVQLEVTRKDTHFTFFMLKSILRWKLFFYARENCIWWLRINLSTLNILYMNDMCYSYVTHRYFQYTCKIFN